MEVIPLQSSQKLVRIIASLTKVFATLTLLTIAFGAVVIVATWISPSPILLRVPRERLIIGIPGLDLIFEFAPEKQLSQAVTFAMLGGLLVAACNYVILVQLHGILATVLESGPFVAENARRLRVIAFALFAIAFLGSLAGVLSGWWKHEMIQIPGVEVVTRWRFDFGPIGVGVLILVLAEVFRVGVAMKEEQDLTV